MMSHVQMISLLSLLLLPTVAYANVVWPALYLEVRLFSWWAISAGLVLETLFVRYYFSLPAKRAFVATLAANIVSALLGIVLIPLAGLLWEFFPASIINSLLGWGTFNPITWGATFLLGCLVNSILEGLVYKKWFVANLQLKSTAFLWLLAVNSLSVAMAFISLWIEPLVL